MSEALQSRRMPVPGARVSQSGRVSLIAIDERPATTDPVLGAIFASMRGSTGLPLPLIAARLGVDLSLVQALEGGHIRVFTSPEQARQVVEAYARLVAVDPRPILGRLLPQIDGAVTALVSQTIPPSAPVRQHSSPASAVARMSAASAPAPVRRQLRAGAMVAAASSTGPVESSRPKARKSSRLVRRLRRVGLVAMIGFGSLIGMVVFAESQPRVAQAAVDTLPQGVARSVRSTIDRVAGLIYGRRDGMRWIEVDNPRSRKTDKLEVKPER